MLDAYAWFASRRGITRETLDAFGVVVDDEGVIRYPYPEDAVKHRKGLEKDEEGGRRFWWSPPTAAGQVPFLPPDFEPRERMLLVEGESDAMALWQNIPDELRDKVSVVGLSGTGSWAKAIRDKGGVDKLFGPAKRVFVLFDRDDPYENADGAASVERAWGEIKIDLGRKARRVILPQGINDVAEFFERYDWAALQVLLKKAAAPIRHYPRLDLSRKAPPTDWLVEDFLVRGEVTVIAADSGVGKSILMQSLSLAIAGGAKDWLELLVKAHGTAMYVDEEQSPQLAMQRLVALASTKENVLETLPANLARNLDYINYAGVDLAREPEKLLEEALDIEPALIVIDSQSRVALGIEENSNTEISQLYRRAFVPLARETNAAVVVIHHATKDGRGTRGAGAIKAASDQTIEIRAAEDKAGQLTGTLNIFPSKPRRKTAYLKARIVGEIEKEGWVRVERAEEDDPF